jgi:hypothetical protein
MTFKKIYEVYKSVGIYNYLFESLASNNEIMQESAMEQIKKLNFKNEDDVMLYIAMSL